MHIEKDKKQNNNNNNSKFVCILCGVCDRLLDPLWSSFEFDFSFISSASHILIIVFLNGNFKQYRREPTLMWFKTNRIKKNSTEHWYKIYTNIIFYYIRWRCSEMIFCFHFRKDIQFSFRALISYRETFHSI